MADDPSSWRRVMPKPRRRKCAVQVSISPEFDEPSQPRAEHQIDLGPLERRGSFGPILPGIAERT